VELEVLKGLIWSVTPIAAGLAIYQVFAFLDKNAEEAREAITNLLQEEQRFSWLTAESRDVAAAIRDLFDRIYVPLPARDGTYAGGPSGPYWKELATWRTCFRSAVITLVVTYVLTYIIFRNHTEAVRNTFLTPISSTFLSGILINIFADYLALYVIRMWLTADGVMAWQALFIAPLAGILLVISFMGLRLIFFMPIDLALGSCYPLNLALHFCGPVSAGGGASVTYLAVWDKEAVQRLLPALASLQFPGVLAACLVHLWLPLFALCVGILKLFHGVWQLLGRDHPLLAIGVVAAVLTFATVALLQGLAVVL
jgi:hypothetical protein